MWDDRSYCDAIIERFKMNGEGGVSHGEYALLRALQKGDKDVRRRLRLGFPVLVEAWEAVNG